MKILHVITDLKIGGESKHLVRSISSLREFQHVVSCLTVTTDPVASPADVRGEIEGLGVSVIDLGVVQNQPLTAARALVRLQIVARRENPNLIHSTLIHANLVSEPLAWSGWPVICSHVATDPWRRNWRRVVDRYIGKRAIFLANSRAVAQSLVAGGLDPTRIRVLYYGVDTDHFRPDGTHAGLAGEHVLLGAGRLDLHKGFEYLIRAAALMPERPSVVLVGDGPLRGHLARRARELGVSL